MMNASKKIVASKSQPKAKPVREEMIGTLKAFGGEPVVVKAHSGRFDLRRVEIVATAPDGFRVAMSFDNSAANALRELLRDAVQATYGGR